MIHYEIIGSVKNPYITKREVTVNREKLEKLKEEIIEKCGEITHHSYDSTLKKVYPDEGRVITNYKYKNIGIKENKGMIPNETLYHIEYDEIKIPYIADLIKDVLLNKENSLIELLDIIYRRNPNYHIKSIKDEITLLKKEKEILKENLDENKITLFQAENLLIKLNKKINLLKEKEETNKNQLDENVYYDQIRNCFSFEIIERLSVEDLKRVTNFFEYEPLKEKNEKLNSTLKRIKKKTDK